MIEKVPTTKEGLEKLRQELNTIITVDRPQNIKAIEEARSHGDLTENAEYHAAKERQSFLEAKINELEMAISRSEVIEISDEPAENIIFGSTVELKNLVNNKTVTYQLVGPYESSPEQGNQAYRGRSTEGAVCASGRPLAATAARIGPGPRSGDDPRDR